MLTGEFTALGVTRMLEAMKQGGARARASTRPAPARCSARCVEIAAARDDAVLPAQPVRRRQGLRPLDHRELPRELRALRGRRASCSTTRAPRRGLEFVTRKITRRRGRASSSAWTTSCALGNLDARRDWGFAGDYVDAMWRMLQQDEPGRLRRRHGRDVLGARVLRSSRSARVGLDYQEFVVQRRALLPPGRGRPARRRPVARRASSSAGSRPSRSSSS